MSKRRKTKVFSFQGFDLAHYKATEAYTRAVSSLFDKATDDIANAASRENYNPDKPFSFDDYPKAKAQLQKTIKGLAGKMQAVIETASRKQWLFACQKNDEFIASIFDTTKLTKGQLKKYQDRNLDALQSFQQRKVGGMDLSERVWKYTQQYKEQIEVGLDVGLGEGRSAQQLSRDLRQNLKDTNRLFRRVRDKRGNLQLSKSAKAFHPGQGVYRSSYKNAMRLARSEINMSYRESDHLRWQQLDFVLGFEVHRSNREPKCNCELCERLVGRYPKWFKFKGWHPQCLCYAIPILEDFYSKERSDDRVARMRAALRGEEYKKYVSKGLIKDLPDNFKEWASENEERQKNWASTPYFIKDNFVEGDLTKGLRYAPTEEATKIDPIQQELDALQPQIVSIRQMCSEWGLNTSNLDAALAARSPKDVVFAISTLKDRVNNAMNELKVFIADVEATIKEARANKVDSNDVFADLQAVKANKRDWLMGKDAMKQRLEDLKAKIKALLSPAHPAILSNYETNAQVNTTFKAINSEFTTEKWFEHGDLSLALTRESGVNGFTYMDGRISLISDRLERVKSALSKIGSGKPKDITFEEADAMATFWHEITHNRNIPGYMSTTKTQTDVMEMMNEFVARKALPEFYGKLGCATTPHPEFIANRESTGYNRRVLGYDFVISKLGLDSDKVLESAKKNLFTLKYTEQETTAKQALLDGGLDEFKGVNGKKIGKAQLNKIVAMCRKGYSTTAIEDYLKDQGII